MTPAQSRRLADLVQPMDPPARAALYRRLGTAETPADIDAIIASLT